MKMKPLWLFMLFVGLLVFMFVIRACERGHMPMGV